MQSANSPKFKKSTLKYATHSDGRLETLYFTDGGSTSRIRIDHPSGCYVQKWRQHVVRYFFEYSSHAKATADFFDNKTWRKEQVEQELTSICGNVNYWSTHPYQGWSQFEITYSKSGRDGRIDNTHFSGGVVSPIPNISDKAIAAIAQLCVQYDGVEYSKNRELRDKIKLAEKL